MRSEAGNLYRRLLHIRNKILLAVRFADGMTYEVFRDDIRTFYAVTRCLEIISEASRRLPSTFKDRHPTIAWKDMAGAGNIYRHDYEDVATLRVWAAVRKDLPPLLDIVEASLIDLDLDLGTPS